MTGLSLLGDVFDPNSPKDWIQWGGLVGVLALVVTGFLKGWLVPGWSHQAEMKTRDDRIVKLEEENREQALFLRDQATPLLTRTQDVLVKILEERAWDERARRQREKQS